MIVQYTCGCWHCLEDDQTPETRCPSCCEKMYTQLVGDRRGPHYIGPRDISPLMYYVKNNMGSAEYRGPKWWEDQLTPLTEDDIKKMIIKRLEMDQDETET